MVSTKKSGGKESPRLFFVPVADKPVDVAAGRGKTSMS